MPPTDQSNVYYPQLRDSPLEVQEAFKYVVDLLAQQAGEIATLQARLTAGGL